MQEISEFFYCCELLVLMLELDNITTKPSSFKKLLLYGHKNIFFQHNIGVFILERVVRRSGASCPGRIVQGASCLTFVKSLQPFDRLIGLYI